MKWKLSGEGGCSDLKELCVQQESESSLHPVPTSLVQLSQTIDVPWEERGEGAKEERGRGEERGEEKGVGRWRGRGGRI